MTQLKALTFINKTGSNCLKHFKANQTLPQVNHPISLLLLCMGVVVVVVKAVVLVVSVAVVTKKVVIVAQLTPRVLFLW